MHFGASTVATASGMHVSALQVKTHASKGSSFNAPPNAPTPLIHDAGMSGCIFGVFTRTTASGMHVSAWQVKMQAAKSCIASAKQTGPELLRYDAGMFGWAPFGVLTTASALCAAVSN